MRSLFRLLLLMIISSVIFSCNQPEKVTESIILVHNKKVNIAYIDTGRGDTTLLFVHGWCINKGYWSNQVAYFSKKYRVVAIDLPGFGASGKNRKNWSTTAYANDIDSAISQLELKNVLLVGHSMAGDIVLQAAIDNPTNVIGIVGVDNFKNVGQPESPTSKKEFAAAITEMKHNFKKVALMYFNQELFSKTTTDTIKKRVLNDVAHADTTIAVAAMEQGSDFDETAKLNEEKTKLYLINSDVHPTDTTGLVKNGIKHKLFYIHGSGHFLMIEDPDEFNLLLEEIIADLAPKQGAPNPQRM